MNNLSQHPINNRKIAQQSLRGRVVSISQTFAARICRFFMKRLGGFTVEARFQFEPTANYIMASNHQSRWDPFAIWGALPISQDRAAGPIKFMTARGLYYSPLRLILATMGCYPTRIKGVDIIEYSMQLMRRGYTLFLFPEGRRTLRSESNPRRGVSELIAHASDFSPQIILVHIEWERLGRIKRHAHIVIAEAPEGLDVKSPQAIMEAIYSL